MAENLELIENRPPSVAKLFWDRVAATPEREAFRKPSGDGWVSYNWQQTGDQVRDLAAGLLAVGIQSEDRVAIASSTRVEWIFADLAIMCVGAATTTIYPTTPSADVGYILRDSGSRVVFAENDEQIAKIEEHRAELPALSTVVTFDGTPDGELVITLEQLAERGRKLLADRPGAVEQASAAVRAGDLATLMYTSGTTGRPKGVRLANDCWVYEGVAVAATGILRQDDVQYLWLPLSHSFGKVLLAAQLAVGMSSAVDGDVTRLVENLAVVRPTFMAGAPRIFEKVYARVLASVEEDGGLKLKIFNWALSVGQAYSAQVRAGHRPGVLLTARYRVADRLVFSKLRHRFGGRIRFFVSGSAPLSKEIAEWFHAAGILICEGYGLTESSAGTFVNRPEHTKLGTVGQVFGGTEVRIAEDGEVLLRGPGVMSGYHNLPEETAAVLDRDGWLHTGDVGELDDEGFLRITDRKKDLIKTSGGKYVAPQHIEVLFKAICPYASNIVVHGDQRNYCTALIAVDAEAIAPWAEQNGLAGIPYEVLVQRTELRGMFAGQIKELNERLPRWETIKDFVILPSDLSIESGELTPSLKVKRSAVEQKYRDLLDAMYAQPVTR